MDNSEEQVAKKLSEIAQREELTLAFWRDNEIFEKSLSKNVDKEDFVFYDGPPFATGLPHYGHILASVIKDIIPRYQTMRGRYVRRVWGWDCHGLPVENLIELELGLKHKKDIEEYGIEKFNDAARASVLRYDTEWKKIIPRLGRWIDMDHSYKTMDSTYTESIWWAFETLYKKGLVYQGFKSMHICPRCETTLSSNEIALGYKDITDISVTVKFALKDETETFILAWTTTPWTLPGNVALAVNPNEDYVKVSAKNEYYIIAAARVEIVFAGVEYSILETIKGSALVGRSYKPIFDYYASLGDLDNLENGWKIYDADFVTMESGTGVVHIAPAFGEDDMALGKSKNLPFIQHVGMDGKMKPEVRDFAGVEVKPKGDHQATDILIIKYLAGAGALFSKEKLIHAYPHCWRCDTPLLNYAAESWFVKSPALKDELIAENTKTSWVPENMRDGRFGKWLENTRDWAISRARYWGAPIPVWTCSTCGNREVLGSHEALASKTKKSGNRYFVMRHGEAESNTHNTVSSKLETNTKYGLTASGRTAVEKTGENLRHENIEIIISSPFLRTKETAEIVAGVIGFDTRNIIIDERIKEIDTGIFDGRTIQEYRNNFSSLQDKFIKRPEGGENIIDVKRRAMALLEELETRYSGKTILLVTHEYPTWMLVAGAKGLDVGSAVALRCKKEDFINTAEVIQVPYVSYPHNADFELDTHRPYIDEIDVVCSCSGFMKRVPYVFDCWFESGSMPYAQFHYPFENKELFERNFPANFIAEGVDQTRGWFYSLLVLSVGLFNKAPFQNVLVNGMVLAEDGQKMSKKLKNYPDPWDILNKYGADAIRYYLLSSPIVHAEDLSFSEKGVDEVVKKVIMRFLNVVSFYEIHGGSVVSQTTTSNNLLDQWILSRLSELGIEMTRALDTYELDRAVKPLALFVDDLSTWYLRRSRERFKSDDTVDRAHAINTTHSVLLEFSKLLAPVMPFLAEYTYQKMKGPNESVHLETWPDFAIADEKILSGMVDIRRVVSLSLEARAKVGIKVRQPLQSVTLKSAEFSKEYIELIKDEVNVKEVLFDVASLEDVVLDVSITPTLAREGQFRELVRTIQDLRKSSGLTPSDAITITISTNDEGKSLIKDFEVELKRATLIAHILYGEVASEPINIEGILFAVALGVEK